MESQQRRDESNMDRERTGRLLQYGLMLCLVVVCLVVLSWTRQIMELPTYWNRDMEALNLADLFVPNSITDPAQAAATQTLLAVGYDVAPPDLLRTALHTDPDMFYAEYLGGKMSINKLLRSNGLWYRGIGSDIRSILNCSLDSVYHSANYRVTVRTSYSESDLEMCLDDEAHRGNILVNGTLSVLLDSSDSCLKLLQNWCLLSSIRILYLPLLNLKAIGPLRDLVTVTGPLTGGIIHVPQDPRKVIGQNYMQLNMDTSLTDAANSLCALMEHNKVLFQQVHSQYRNRVFELKAEVLLSQPLNTVLKLYKFIGSEAPEEVLEMVYSNRHLRLSGSTADHLPQQIISMVNRQCGAILHVYNYVT